MPAASVPAHVASELAGHPAREALVARARGAALEAARGRRVRFLREPSPPPPDVPELGEADAETRFGNVAQILASGARNASEAQLISVLVALGVASDFPSAPETEQSRARELVFLAAYTPVNALAVADAVLGEERTRPLWRAVAALADPATAEDRSEAVAALALLAAASSEPARAASLDLAEKSSDPLVQGLVERGRPSTSAPARLSGELAPPPHGPVGTTLLALSGLLFLLRGARLVGRLGLAYKQPAELWLSERGLEIEHRTELLGRVLRSKQTLVPLGNLARVTREVRYPRLGLYLGLAMLCLGTYLGMGLLVDGTRVPGGSAPLLGMGLLLIVLGLAIDYGLTLLSDNVRGRCRVLIVPKKGRSVCVGALDPTRADAMLSALGARTQA